MASTSVQSRISEFESLRYNKYSPPSLLEAPLSPTASSLKPIKPQVTPPKPYGSPSMTPPSLDRKSSTVDLGDWVVDDGPSKDLIQSGVMKNNVYPPNPTQQRFGNGMKTSNSAPLINLDSPPKLRPVRENNKQASESKPPPLPPRKPSYTSLKQAASPSPKRSDSLTVEHPHTYPPLPKLNLTTNTNDSNNSNGGLNGSLRIGLGHAPASSISSFHSVSLSSDGSIDHDPSTPGSVSSNFIASYPIDRADYHSTTVSGDITGSSNSSRPMTSTNGSEADTVSLDESFENVSTTSLGSPATTALIAMDWERALAKNKYPYTPRSSIPPKLPQRPASAASRTSPSASKSPPPPVPPPPKSAPMSPKIQPTSSASSSYSSVSATSTLTAVPNGTRRKPPPPPPSSYPSPPKSQPSSPPIPPPRPGSSRISLTSNSASDRSSILSTSTNTSRSSFIAMQPAESVPGSTGSKMQLLLFRGQTQSPKLNAAILRPTPVPVAARQRYEVVFRTNLEQARKAERELRKKGKQRAEEDKLSGLGPKATKGLSARRAAGWRGLSVDLITGAIDEPARAGDDNNGDEDKTNGPRKFRPPNRTPEVDDEEWEDLARTEGEEKLDGCVVRLIWSRSRLDRDRLRRIWLECDPTGSGCLTRDAFVRGMWRIDEELRRARIRSSASSAASMSSLSLKGSRGVPLRKGADDVAGSDVARRLPPSVAKPKAILR